MSGRGKEFEKEVGKSFIAYAATSRAFVDFMPMPTYPCGLQNGRPLYAIKGKPPFDAFGWDNRGMAVGLEIKETAAVESSLALLGPEAKGSGLQFHQIDALANLANAGGIARVVWSNGGDVGYIGNQAILTAWAAFIDAITTERSGRVPARGAKSIPWSIFKKVEYVAGGGQVYLDWLNV